MNQKNEYENCSVFSFDENRLAIMIDGQIFIDDINNYPEHIQGEIKKQHMLQKLTNTDFEDIMKIVEKRVSK